MIKAYSGSEAPGWLRRSMLEEEAILAEARTVIITGAGSGIGLATAQKLHGDGYAIVGVGRDAGKLAHLEAVLGGTERLATLSVDVTAADAPARIVRCAIDRFGRIDCLVNNAGMGSPKPVHETDDAFLDQSIDLMLRAPFRLTREVLPHLGEGASIVNVTTTFAHIGGRRAGAYAATKGGIRSLTEHMACEYGPQGIRSNCVAPGVTRTEMVAHRFEDEAFKRVNIETTPWPRLTEPEDVANVIAFLCSPASEMINGQSIIVDGGWTGTKYLSPRVTRTRWVEPEDG